MRRKVRWRRERVSWRSERVGCIESDEPTLHCPRGGSLHSCSLSLSPTHTHTHKHKHKHTHTHTQTHTHAHTHTQTHTHTHKHTPHTYPPPHTHTLSLSLECVQFRPLGLNTIPAPRKAVSYLHEYLGPRRGVFCVSKVPLFLPACFAFRLNRARNSRL